MMGIGINSNSYAYATVNYSKTEGQKEKTELDETTETDIAPKTETYKPDMKKINAMKAENKNNLLAFKQMVYAMMKQQGGYASDALKSLLDIDETTRLEAQEAISEDGYWGVNQTAERILDFAKALSGGDLSKIPALKDAVMIGFEAAEKVFGGKLPDISYQTKRKIVDGFDEWEKTSEVQK